MAGSEREIIGGVAILDANVLVPISITNFLLTAATEFHLLRPYVSPKILEETRRNILGLKNSSLSSDSIDSRLRSVSAHTIGSSDQPELPADPTICEYINDKDHHVLAAALHHEADLIITNDQGLVKEVNLWVHDQSDGERRLWGALTANAFTQQLVRHRPVETVLTIRMMADRYNNPRRTPAEVHAVVAKSLPALNDLPVG